MLARLKATELSLNHIYGKGAELILALDNQSVSSARDLIDSTREGLNNGKSLAVTISWYTNKRSLDANAYMWVICQAIAEKLRTTKEEIYRHAIKDKGPFEIILLRDDVVERFINVWKSRGLGWIAEVFGNSKHEGCKNVIAYYGSSEYDTREMSQLIDYLVSQAKELGIPLLSDDEIDLLKREWKRG